MSKRDRTAITLAVKQLSTTKLIEAQESQVAISEEIMGLRNSLYFFSHEYDGEKKEEHMSVVRDRLAGAEECFNTLRKVKNLAELRAIDQEGLCNDLEWILLETVRYFDVSKTVILEYTAILATEIMLDYPWLTMEDVLLCFQRAKDGAYGEVYARIDGQVIKGWLRQYNEARDALIAGRNTSRHMASKAGNNHGRTKPEDPAKMLELAKAQIALNNAKGQ